MQPHPLEALVIGTTKTMKKLRLEFIDTELQYDKNYGSLNKTGWSIFYKGACLIELEHSLLKCLFKYYLFMLGIKASEDI